MADFAEYMEQLKNIDFNDIDWERVGVWPAPVRIFLCVVTAIFIVTASYFLFVKDKNTQLASAGQKEQSLRKSFETKAFEASNLDSYRKQMEEMEESFGALVAQLPSDTEVPGLLEDIDEKGIDSRLIINSIKLQPEKAAEFYVELPIKIKVSGGYHDFGSFVSGIAGMPRIVTLHDYIITKAKNGNLLNMDVTAKTYRYKSQDE